MRTVKQLREALVGVPDDMEVVVRVQGSVSLLDGLAPDEELDVCVLGGVTSAQADAGCDEEVVFLIDGDENEVPDSLTNEGETPSC